MRFRAAIDLRRADFVRDPDRVAFQAAINKLTNWQRTMYLRHGTPDDVKNVAYYGDLRKTT